MSNIKEFINLIIEEKFAKAHEVLEDTWIKCKKEGHREKALFYKALINGATSIELIKRKRSQRAKDITWNAFLKYEELIENLDLEKKEDYISAVALIKDKREKFL